MSQTRKVPGYNFDLHEPTSRLQGHWPSVLIRGYVLQQNVAVSFIEGEIIVINHDDPYRYHNYIINLKIALNLLSNEELVDKTNIIDKMLARLQQYIDFYSDLNQYHIIFASYQEMELYGRLSKITAHSSHLLDSEELLQIESQGASLA